MLVAARAGRRLLSPLRESAGQAPTLLYCPGLLALPCAHFSCVYVVKSQSCMVARWWDDDRPINDSKAEAWRLTALAELRRVLEPQAAAIRAEYEALRRCVGRAGLFLSLSVSLSLSL